MFTLSNLILFAVFALTSLAGCFGIENGNFSSGRGVYHNPILDFGVADPFVFQFRGFYYMSLSHFDGITVYKSPILSDWRNAERREVYKAPPGLMNLWAPEIHYAAGNWYIYFALDDGDNANHRMYVIRALDWENPLGEYSPHVRLSTPTEDYWAIDGTILQYGNGRLYFLWSGWPQIDSGSPQNLYIAPMSNPTTISGPRVLIREPKSGWEMVEMAINEGPQIIQNNGRTFLIFSASGSWTPDYCLGMMGIDGLRDPLVPANWWRDVDRCVFWRNDAMGVYGTGHASFTYSPDESEPWMVYHAMEVVNGGWNNRTARAEKFGWNSDSSPSFPRPNGFHVALPTPSGE